MLAFQLQYIILMEKKLKLAVMEVDVLQNLYVMKKKLNMLQY